jgi:plastocyanin
MHDELTRPDLAGEVRFRVPLVFAIPFGILLFIAVLAIGFSRVLLAVPHDAATAIAIVMAANVLGACAFIAARRRVGRGSMVEIVLVALYPVIVGIGIAQFGLGTEETTAAPAEAPPAAEAPAAGAPALTASGTAWDTDQLTLAAEKPNDVEMTNDDPVVHNMSIYETPEDAESHSNPLFKGEDLEPGSTTTYTVDPLKKGEYAFICDYHSNMSGTVTVE